MAGPVSLRWRGGGIPPPPTFTSSATFNVYAENNIDYQLTTSEACIFVITGGADQAQFILNGSVLTTYAQASSAGPLVVTVRATSIATGQSSYQTLTATVVGIIATKLAPTVQWDGTAGTGYGTANPAAPVDPVRTGPKMALRLLYPPEVAFSDDYTLVVSAGSDDGVQYVTFCCEGTFTQVMAPKWWSITKPDGTTVDVWGYGIQFDWATIQAFGFTEGEMTVYAVATPPAGSTIQERVIGPYLYYARNSGVGSGCVYDFEVQVDPLGVTDPGVLYTTIVEALLYCSQNSKLRPHIVLDRTTRYSTDGSISAAPHSGNMWWTIEPAPGVTATLGAFDITDTIGTSWYCDNLHFKGDIIFELAAMAPKGGGMYRGQAGQNNKLWIDGGDVTGGDYTGSGVAGGYGSGQGITYYGRGQNSYFFSRNNANPYNFYFTHMSCHDIPGYALDLSNLILDCDVYNCSGSAIENNYGVIQGLRLSSMGGTQSGERSFNEVFTLEYTGTATLAEFNKLTQNGRNTISGSPTTYPLTFWEDSAPAGSLDVIDTGTSSYTSIQDLVDYANTLPGWTATATGTAEDLAWGANYVAINDMVPSAGIGTVGESATPFSKRTITSSPLTFYRIADVHSNAIVVDGALSAENCIIELSDCYDIVTSEATAINSVKDFVIRYVTFQDTSAAYQTANPTHDPTVAAQVGIYGGTTSHLVVDSVVYEGPGQSMVTQLSSTSFDSACVIRNSVYEAFSFGGPATLAFDGSICRTGSLPSTADSTSVALAGAYTEDELFLDPFGALPDYTPISSNTTLTTGKFAGAKVPASLVTTYNKGWNLGSLKNTL